MATDMEKQLLAEQFALKYLKRYKKQIISRFAFEGDEDFTKRKQKLFFNLAFDHLNVGVVNTDTDEFGVQIVRLAPSEWNYDGSIKKATMIKGITKAIGNNLHLNVDNLTMENTVGFSWKLDENDGNSLLSDFQTTAYKLFISLFYELLQMIPKSNILVLMQKAGQTSDAYMNDVTNGIKKVIEVPNNNESHNALPNTEEKDSPIGKLDLSSNMKEFIESVDNLIKLVDNLLGIRTASTFKKSQISQVELQDATASIFASERMFLDAMEIFVEEYNEKFGKELKLIDYLQGQLENEKEEINNNKEEIDPTHNVIDGTNKGAK